MNSRKGGKKMFKNLCVWALPGGQVPRDEPGLRSNIELAKLTGYDSTEIKIETVHQLGNEKSLEYVKGLFLEEGIIPAGWQVSDAWRGNEEEYQQLLKMLPLWAETAQKLNCKRSFIWIPNASDERNYYENFVWHIKRLKPIVSILRDYSCRLGLEWQGPKTLRIHRKYEFIHDMKGMLQLCEAIDQNNTVGHLLDSFHWYTSYGTLEDIKSLRGDQVIYIHLNDAPKGVPIDEQIDWKREIPGSTGVIDLVGFLKVLHEIGYNGPVEPTAIGSEILEKMSLQEAAKANCDALEKLFQAVGIS